MCNRNSRAQHPQEVTAPGRERPPSQPRYSPPLVHLFSFAPLVRQPIRAYNSFFCHYMYVTYYELCHYRYFQSSFMPLNVE